MEGSFKSQRMVGTFSPGIKKFQEADWQATGLRAKARGTHNVLSPNQASVLKSITFFIDNAGTGPAFTFPTLIYTKK